MAKDGGGERPLMCVRLLSIQVWYEHCCGRVDLWRIVTWSCPGKGR